MIIGKMSLKGGMILQPNQFNQEQIEQYYRQQRRRRNFFMCFTLLATLIFMNMLTSQIQRPGQPNYIEKSEFDQLNFVQLTDMLQVIETNMYNFPKYNQDIIGFQNGNSKDSDNLNNGGGINNGKKSALRDPDFIEDDNLEEERGEEEENDGLDIFDINEGQKQQKDIQNDDENKEDGELQQEIIDQINDIAKLDKSKNMYELVLYRQKYSKFIQENKAILSDEQIKRYNGLIQIIVLEKIEYKKIVRQLLKKLGNKNLEGFWKFNENKSKSFQYENNKGIIQTVIYMTSSGDQNSKAKFIVNAYDGQYYDQQRFNYELDIESKHIMNHTFGTKYIDIEDKVDIDFEQYDSYNYVNKIECQAQVRLEFLEQHDNPKMGQIKVNVKSMNLKGENCNIDMSFDINEIQKDKYWKEAIIFTFLITLLAISYLYGILKVLKKVLNRYQEANNYSLPLLIVVFLWDGYFTATHIVLAIQENGVFQYLMPVAILFVFLWLIFQKALLVQIWKIQNVESIQSEAIFRKRLVIFQVKIFLAMITLFFFRLYIYNDYCIIFVNAYLFLQIGHNAYRGQQTKTDNHFIWCLVIPRTALFLYTKGISHNLYHLHPSLLVFFSIIALMAIQIAILYGQEYYGIRFFVPQIFLPYKYNYFVKIPENLDLESGYDQEFTEECTICFAPLHTDPGVELNETNSQTISYIRRLKSKKNQIMRTPCNHDYHIACLANWMNIKMECPTCRATLPSI